MKRIFCKVALWVLDRLLGEGDPPSPRLRRTSWGKDVSAQPVAEVLPFGGKWPKSAYPDVEVTLYGGPADGWVEKIPTWKPWPEMMLVKVDPPSHGSGAAGVEAHAYEMVEGRAVFRHVRQVGFFLGCNFEKGVVWP